ncbi:Uncharacterised protein [Mycobacteroides abscessus subsp. abscessus]|nr:Uncharacterised protein [Mycobacteroides abscessus subsp. abscessus]SIK92633.1 Uncharacterised protein [Mycobacteroides abscessus subsp. abscessus]
MPQEVVGELKRLLRAEQRIRLHRITHRATQVIEQVLTHLWRVVHDRNSELTQSRGLADTRKHQQLGRIDGASTQNDLAPRVDGMGDAVAHILNAHGADAVEQHPARLGVGDHVQVAPP